MDGEAGYGQFCPVAMAAEVLCRRWTLLIVRELLAGSTRFNALRRGLPRMSPTLLSKRLGELEEAGIVTRGRDPRTEAPVYELTAAGRELEPLVMTMGTWGQKWLESQLSLKNLDPSLLMWDMRRNLNPTPLPPRRVTIQFQYPEVRPAQRRWWLIVEKAEVDLCAVEPGFDIDLFVQSDLRTMTAIWMGLTTVARALDEDRLALDGDRALADRMQSWLGLSPFATATA
ncbi:MAG: transcriptional regulator [Deinococcus-Thermus bacterium]|jgi:DNA-binding HxlR family transcriptional regulator|nr:transcriptional regulator [Deinococcota bacterium]